MKKKNKIKKKNELLSLRKYVKEERFFIGFLVVLLFIGGLASTLSGYLNGTVIEHITNLNLKSALIFLGIYVGVNIVESLIEIYASTSLLKVENRISRKLGYYTYVKALNLPAYAYEEKTSGEIINRVTNDADSLSYVFYKLINIVSSLIGSVMIFIYILMNSWVIAVQILCFLIVIYFVMKYYTPKLNDATKKTRGTYDRFISLVNESIRGIREVKTLGIKNRLRQDVADISTHIYGDTSAENDVRKSFRVCTRFLRILLEGGTFITCIYLLYYGQISLAFFIAMTYYIYRFMWVIDELNDFTEVYQNVNVSLERVNELLENRLYQDVKFGCKVLEEPQGVIEFKNVTFRYPKEGKTLDNFNLKIEPGKKIAIVGASGQGKSTLFNLLTRIFDPQKGVITLDGIDIKDLTEEELRHHISIIRQEPFIFNRTILENFKLLDEKIKISDIKKYTKMAYLDEYIESLPKKYNTILGEGGVNLSGGQKQRLAIARTLSKDSKVILFDEATSALDNNSQEFIKRAIDELVENHTVIIVAHRLSTIQDADIIHVVDKGKIVESGTHNQLMKKSKIYKNLYKNESLSK